MAYQSVNPNDGKVLISFEHLTPAQLAQSLAAAQGGIGDQDDTVVLPLHTLQRRVTGSRRVSTVRVSMQDGADSAALKASLRQLLRERRKLADNDNDSDDDNFNIFDTQQLADTLSSTLGVLTRLLSAVAAESLWWAVRRRCGVNADPYQRRPRFGVLPYRRTLASVLACTRFCP